MKQKISVLIFLMSILILLSFVRSSAAQEETPIAAPDDADLPLAGVAYVADFATEPDWSGGEYQDGTMTWGRTIDGHASVVSMPEGPARFARGSAYTATNFYTEMTFTPVACDTGESAMLFNVRTDPTADNPTSASSYVFVVECDGTYRSRPVNNGVSGIIDFMRDLDAPLTIGEPMNIGVLLRGRHVTWFIDGVMVGDYFGSTRPDAGQFALGVQLGMEAEVSRLVVWEISDDPAADTDSDTETPAENPLFTYSPARNIVIENFQNPDHPLMTAQGEAFRTYRVDDTLIVSTRQATARFAMTDAPPSNYETYYIEVVFLPRHCADEGAFGLALGDYSITISCGGDFVSRYHSADGSEDVMLDAQFSALEPFGRGHTVGAVVQGDTVFAYFDSQPVGSFSVQDADQQPIGLFWQTTPDAITEIQIDNFSIVELLLP